MRVKCQPSHSGITGGIVLMNNNTNNKGIGRKLRMQKKDKMDRVEQICL